jgi:hypothetical protein
MKGLQVIEFLQKHQIFLHANALWKYDKKLGASTIIWPNNNSKIRIWHNQREKQLVESHYNYRNLN